MTMPVPVRAVAIASSTELHDVQELAASVGLPDGERRKLHENGLRAVPIAQANLIALVEEVVDSLDASDCVDVIFAHSLELNDTTADQLAESLSAALPRLERHPLMVTGRPCSVIHLGVELAMRRWRRGCEGSVLLLGGDIAPTHSDRFFFGSTMGDAAVGLVVGAQACFGDILATYSTWHILAANGAASEPEEILRFRAQNPTAIRATIDGALRAAGLMWHELSAIVPHTPYRQIWDTVAELCRFPRDRILDQGIVATGHLNSNDVIVHLSTAVREGAVRPGDVAALVSPGFGGSRGCTLVRVS